MRLAAVVTVLILFAAPVFAQLDGKTSLSLFVSNPSYGWTEHDGSTTGGGLGLGLSHRFNADWGAEIQASVFRSDRWKVMGFEGVNPNLPYLRPIYDVERVDVYPVDLTARYHIPVNWSRWSMYASAGVRYVGAPDATRVPVLHNGPGGEQHWTIETAPRESDRTSAELAYEFAFRMTDHTGLVFDLRQLLRNDDVNWDPTTRFSFGFRWAP